LTLFEKAKASSLLMTGASYTTGSLLGQWQKKNQWIVQWPVTLFGLSTVVSKSKMAAMAAMILH